MVPQTHSNPNKLHKIPQIPLNPLNNLDKILNPTNPIHEPLQHNKLPTI